MDHNPEEQASRDAAREPGYIHAVTFRGADAERRAKRAYKDIRDELRRAQADLSVYRLFEPTGRALPIGWYVTLIGEQPPADLERRLHGHLRRGEPVALPGEVIAHLGERRREAAALGPWVERRDPRY